MSTTGSAAIGAVQAMYTAATQHLSMMLAACHDDTERNSVWEQYYALRQNFDDCVNRKFQEDDAALQQFEASAAVSTRQLQQIETQLGDIVKVLNTLTQAVGVGVKIAAKVLG
ncbi:hypothetical protein [Terriglobus aquaticus]|uniref:Uncharacterized protein n=1 Tax=Terriglobus aquaticus TaxID=940139 RepID=A0ABW9KMU3_9BACT|nr:hypothetical protein [Terriglobus aquaticus]